MELGSLSPQSQRQEQRLLRCADTAELREETQITAGAEGRLFSTAAALSSHVTCGRCSRALVCVHTHIHTRAGQCDYDSISRYRSVYFPIR